MDVAVVHLQDRLMERQLDAAAAALLKSSLESRGIKLHLKAHTQELLGAHRVRGVRLADGTELPADLVVIAVGIRPNIELALRAGLRCDRGVLVDDTLQTFDPSIYAVGECVQHRNTTFGLVAPLWEQARVCAAHLAELGVRRYRTRPPSARLKVTGIELYSAGDIADSDACESIVVRDLKRGVYKRLVIRDNRLQGAVLYGDVQDAAWYGQLIEGGHELGELRAELGFGPVAAATAG
jgi:nitrite reductase (NADH) large subunit